MTYRVYVYFDDGAVTVKLTSESITWLCRADALLTALLAMPGVTGGGLEEKVENIGWVLHS